LITLRVDFLMSFKVPVRYLSQSVKIKLNCLETQVRFLNEMLILRATAFTESVITRSKFKR